MTTLSHSTSNQDASSSNEVRCLFTSKTWHGVAILNDLSHNDAQRGAAIVTEVKLVVSAATCVVRVQSTHVVLIQEVAAVPVHEHLRDVHALDVQTSAANANEHEGPLCRQRYICWVGGISPVKHKKRNIFWFIV